MKLKMRVGEFVDDGATLTFKSTIDTIDWASLAVVLVCSAASASLPLLPFRRDTITFRILSDHDSFVVVTMLAFTSALTAVLLDGKPEAARVSRNSAIACLSMAILLLARAIFF